MSEKIPIRKDVKALIYVCALVYIAAYIGRLSYTSSMVGVMEATGAGKDAAGLVSTFFYFAYGCGQLVNAFFCRKYKPRPVIAGVLIVSALCNGILSLGLDVSILKFVWFVNGAAQSMLWCTIIETLSKKVPPEHKNRAIFTMSTTVAIGTTAAYSVSATCISFGHVFWTFRVAFVTLLIICGIWLFVTKDLSKMENCGIPSVKNEEKTDGKSDSLAVLLAGAGGLILCVGILALGNGFIKDTMVTWVPSLLYDKFGLPSQYSVLITLLLPLFSIFGAAIGVTLHRRVRSYYALLGIVYTASTVVLMGCFLSYRLHIMVLLIAFAAANGCFMATANNIVTSMIPLERKSGSGLFAGIMDAFCYVGSTASGILPGLLLERNENGFTVLLLLIPAFALLLMAFALGLWLKERAKNKNN